MVIKFDMLEILSKCRGGNRGQGRKGCE